MSEQPTQQGQPQQPPPLTPEQQVARANSIINQLRNRLAEETDKNILKDVDIENLQGQLEQERQFRITMAAEIQRLKDAYEPEVDPDLPQAAEPEVAAEVAPE